MTHTRLAYSEIHDDEKDTTCAAFLHRTVAWFAAQGVTVRRVVTDNAVVYRHGTDWDWGCAAWQLKRRFTKPGCPGPTAKPTVQPHPAQLVGLRPTLDPQQSPPPRA